MRKIIEATVENLSHDGRGVARVNGKTTFIQGALPGELVTFTYTKVKKDFDEGVLVSVVEQSPARVEPQCQHYQVCGGCSLQHLSPLDQLQLKEQHLLEVIARFGHTAPEQLLPAIKGPHWHYRNKARLSVRFVEKKQSALVGFRERASPRYIAEITHCPVLHSKVDQDIPALRNLMNSLDDKHCIAQIEVAAGEDAIALILRNMRDLQENDQQKLKQFAEEHQYILFLQPGGPDTVHCFYPPDAAEYLSYTLPEHKVHFAFHPTDFIQVNATMNVAMVNQALQLMALTPSDKVLDLFCGLGNFTLPMARLCSQVTGVEGSDTMVKRALMNARRNQIDNVSFFSANLDDPLAVKNSLAHAGNKMLVDPPRSGALEIVQQIDLKNPERIVYVSCNPITLARDADVLVNQKGYLLHSAGVLDMFPHTAHVESMALFVKR